MPAESMEDDYFYDLFGEKGLLTPESTNGSTDQDSGLGSPFGSNVDDASPLQFAYDAADDHHGEIWGSFLDDLPSDITDDSDSNAEQQQPLFQNFDLSKLNTLNDTYNETLSWSTKVLEESINYASNTNNTINFVDDWSLDGNVFNNAKQAHLPLSMDYLATANNNNNNNKIPSQVTPINMNVESSTMDLIKENGCRLPTSAPAVIPPSHVVGKGPWVVKASDIKSHFQIGQNIISILQRVEKNVEIDDEIDMCVDNEKESSDVDSLFHILGGEVKTSAPPNEGNSTMHINSDHDYAEKDKSHLLQTSGVSQGMGPGLTLTDEEKKLLEMESLKLPEDVPLTKEEEKVLKKVRRKIKNKQSAMESRRRRKEYTHNLEHRVKHCTDLNNELTKKLDKLSKENKSLVNELKVMKEYCKSIQQTRAVNTGTCLAVLLLSFALFILPFNPLVYFGGKSETIPGESPIPTTMFRSRTLLAIDDNTDYTYQDNEFTNSSYSMSYYNNYFHEPRNESLTIHLENFGDSKIDYTLKADISLYTNENFTWFSMLNNTSYVTS